MHKRDHDIHPSNGLRVLALAQLDLQDEASFRHVALYGDLKRALIADDYRVQMLPEGVRRWEHALLLNLAFWDARGASDTLVDDSLPADVVCHMAWHHLASGALGDGEQPLSAPALLLGEAIASAFDLYLMGRLLGHCPDSDFLLTQLPAMAEVAEAAGVGDDAFAKLMDTVRADPEGAFEDLRCLLYDVTMALWQAKDAEGALEALMDADGHRFACLLHHFELANWLMHARAAPDNASSAAAVALDGQLRAQTAALDWLSERWGLTPPRPTQPTPT